LISIGFSSFFSPKKYKLILKLNFRELTKLGVWRNPRNAFPALLVRQRRGEGIRETVTLHSRNKIKEKKGKLGGKLDFVGQKILPSSFSSS